jgi:hypothetical protein
VDGDVGTGDGWRFNEPPRTRPPVFPLGEDFEGAGEEREELEERLLPEEDGEELEELLFEEELEELDEERLEDPPPLLFASALGKLNHSEISGLVGLIVTCAKQRKAIEKINQRWNLSIRHESEWGKSTDDR